MKFRKQNIVLTSHKDNQSKTKVTECLSYSQNNQTELEYVKIDLEHMKNLYNLLCIEYSYATSIASKSGLNLQIYGKRVKPYLRKRMSDIESFYQLELGL